MKKLIKSINFNMTAEDRMKFYKEVGEVFDSNYYTLGPNTKKFENAFSKYTNIEHSVAFNCASAGLECMLRELNKEGGTVIVPTNTNFATAAVVLRAGGKVKFADIDEDTLSCSVDTISGLVDGNTKGVIVVHLGGIISPKIYELRDYCKDNGLFLIEDAAHAHGSHLDGNYAGSFSDGASYSFHPGKLITCGEGGLLVTKRKDINLQALKYRDQGRNKNQLELIDPYKQHETMGYSWRLSEISACLGYINTLKIDEYIEARSKVAKVYDQGIQKINGAESFKVPTNLRFNYHKYIVFLENGIDTRYVYKKMLENHNIELSSFVYRGLCHEQPVFKDIKKGSYPNAEKFSKRHICLPIHDSLSNEDCEYVLKCLDETINEL